MANNNHFNLTLDTLAPTGSIARPAHYLKNNTQNLAISYTVGDAVLMKVWFNTSASGSESDAEYSTANWEAVAQTKATNFSTDGNYYYHVQFMDSVNNKSVVYNTEEIIYDTTAPVVNSLTLTDSTSGSHLKTDNLTIDWSFAYTEAHPGRYVISATDMTNNIDVDSSIPASPVSGTLTFDAGAEDGDKVVTVTLYDLAGNVSTSVQQTINLDTHLDVPVIQLTTIPEQGDEAEAIAANSYINFHGVRVNATDSDTGVVKYRIYEVISGQDAPAYQTQSADKLDETVDLTLSNNDGAKVIRVDVEDDAGNTNYATVTINIDTVAPVATISSQTSVISSQNGYDTAQFNLTGTDASAGVKGYEIWCNSTRIVNANGAVPATYNLTKAIAGGAMVEGNNTIKLVVIDTAENSGEATTTLIYDSTAPSITIGALPGTSNGWYNAPFNPSVTISDARLDGFYIWVNNTEVDTDITGHSKRSWSSSTIDAQNIEGWSGLSDSETCYLHVVAYDQVGNNSADYESFKFDKTAPTITSVSFGLDAYPSQAASITITANDNLSGLWKMQVTGDITNGTASGSWENFSSSRSVTLTAGDGNKTVTVVVKDEAGNTSASAQDTCELDTVLPAIVISLYEPDGITPKAAHSPVPNFVAHIQVGDDSNLATGNVRYKVYGDYTIGSQAAQGTAEPTDYITFVPDQGKLYYTLTGICTSNSVGYDDNKVIFVKAIDNAGNENDSSASFYYDTKAPEVSVTNIDYQVISKVHEVRYEGITATTKYADEVHFTITPDEIIKSYKVCAYLNAGDAVAEYPAEGRALQDAWVEAQVAIPTDGGSNHMSGSASSSAAIQCLLKGADYENALKARYQEAPENVDGAHVVVVYVQDNSGTWSTIAEFDVVNNG